jgi:ASC-1-like (ASCH) protein
VHPFTDDAYKEHWEDGQLKKEYVGTVTCYPFVLGYATTIYKLQGTELDHITIWLDRPYIKASAYMALSRIRKDEDYLICGHVERKHFIPADFKPRDVRSSRMSGIAWTARRQDVSRAPGEVKEHSLPIQQQWADAIAAGTKVVEGRLARGAVMRVHVGDTLVFRSIYTRVVQIEHYDSFYDMLDAVGVDNALPGTASIEDGVEIYLNFRGYGDAEASCGVRALHVELIE